MESLKLRVQVLLVVRAICESVQTNAVLVVGRQILELHCVPSLDDISHAQRDNLVLVAFGADGHGLVIHAELSNSDGLKVNEQVCIVRGQLVQVEVNLSVSKVVVAFLECELIVVLDFTNEFTALGCLLS